MRTGEEQALRRKIGDLNAYCGFEDFVYNDGPARGMRAFRLYNGQGTELTVLADRGLDIPYLSFKGQQLGFVSKTGLKSPALYAEDGARGFLRQFYGGLLTTCGISYAGAAYEEGGQSYGLHGPFSNTPAQRVAARALDLGGERVLEVSGEIRQSQVFSENLVMNRRLLLYTERNRLLVTDRVENQGFIKSPLMLVYHINFGYPMLDAGARVYSSAKAIRPRDENARLGMARWNVMDEPSADRPEECFFHTGSAKAGFAMLHNPSLGVAAAIRYDAALLPLLCEWKCMREGDYALGLEPTTSSVMGRKQAREDGILQYLLPGEQREFSLELELLDKAEDIRALVQGAAQGKDLPGPIERA